MTDLTRDEVLAMPAGPELGCLVHARVFGKEIAGHAHVSYPDGGPYIRPLRPGETGRPVFVSRCECAEHRRIDARHRREHPGYEPEGADVFGHYPFCLAPVPDYGADIAAAWEVLQSIGGRGEVAWGLFFAELFCAVTRRIGRPIHYTDVLFLLTPEDICKAALLMTLTEPT